MLSGDVISVTRRKYLLAASGGLGTALSGCIPSSGPSDFQRRRVTLLSVGNVPSDIPFSLSVRMSRPKAVPAHPPQFTISITNESDQQKHIQDEGVPNNLYLQRSSPPGYILIHWGEPKKRKAKCWESKEQYGMTGIYGNTELQPNESTTGVISLWGTEDASECWPTGEFAIRQGIAIEENPPGMKNRTLQIDDDTLWTFEWSFRFEVTHLD